MQANNTSTLNNRHNNNVSSTMSHSSKEETVSFLQVLQDVFSCSGFTYSMLTGQYLSRLAFVVTFFAIASYANAVAAVVAGWHTPNIIVLGFDGQPLSTRHFALPDLGHAISVSVQSTFPTFFAELAKLDVDWNNLMLNFFGFPLIFFGLAHPKRLMMTRRVCFIFGCVNILRALCVTLTSMPDASPRCTSQFSDMDTTGAYKLAPIFPRALFRAFRVMFNPAENITCGDMIFSGHTVLITLSALLVRTYYTPAHCSTPLIRYLEQHTSHCFLPFIRTFFSVGVVLGAATFVGTRLHYTLDVFIALLVTTSVWWVYHTIVEIDELRHRNPIIAWLEHDLVTQVDIQAYANAIKPFKTR